MHGPTPADELTRGFVERLGQLGYVEGRNISIERRSAEGQRQRLAEVIKELVHLRVDVIVALGEAALEARRATSDIPIVAYISGPVEAGLTTSLSRPTRNVTGVTIGSDLSTIGKRLQLLKQAAPRAQRVAVIDFKYVDAKATPGTHERRLAAEAAARGLNLTLVPVGLDNAEDLDQALAVIDRERADAMMDMGTPPAYVHRRRIIDFAAQRRLPAIYACRTCVEEGGLMSYGGDSNGPERLAEYADKILRGAKPADLPFEEPTKYELVINLKTASLLGLRIPESLLIMAEVIK
jgi:putative ABC transport system substrate-binding protein